MTSAARLAAAAPAAHPLAAGSAGARPAHRVVTGRDGRWLARWLGHPRLRWLGHPRLRWLGHPRLRWLA
jgi:hypothetical protein